MQILQKNSQNVFSQPQNLQAYYGQQKFSHHQKSYPVRQNHQQAVPQQVIQNTPSKNISQDNSTHRPRPSQSPFLTQRHLQDQSNITPKRRNNTFDDQSEIFNYNKQQQQNNTPGYKNKYATGGQQLVLQSKQSKIESQPISITNHSQYSTYLQSQIKTQNQQLSPEISQRQHTFATQDSPEDQHDKKTNTPQINHQNQNTQKQIRSYSITPQSTRYDNAAHPNYHLKKNYERKLSISPAKQYSSSLMNYSHLQENKTQYVHKSPLMQEKANEQIQNQDQTQMNNNNKIQNPQNQIQEKGQNKQQQQIQNEKQKKLINSKSNNSNNLYCSFKDNCIQPLSTKNKPLLNQQPNYIAHYQSEPNNNIFKLNSKLENKNHHNLEEKDNFEVSPQFCKFSSVKEQLQQQNDDVQKQLFNNEKKDVIVQKPALPCILNQYHLNYETEFNYLIQNNTVQSIKIDVFKDIYHSENLAKNSIRLVFIIDSSGTMSQKNKLQQTLNCLLQIISNLIDGIQAQHKQDKQNSPQITISLISFDCQGKVIFQDVQLENSESLKRIKQGISAIQLQSYFIDKSKGLIEALRHFENIATNTQYQVTSLFIITDGQEGDIDLQEEQNLNFPQQLEILQQINLDNFYVNVIGLENDSCAVQDIYSKNQNYQQSFIYIEDISQLGEELERQITHLQNLVPVLKQLVLKVKKLRQDLEIIKVSDDKQNFIEISQDKVSLEITLVNFSTSKSIYIQYVCNSKEKDLENIDFTTELQRAQNQQSNSIQPQQQEQALFSIALQSKEAYIIYNQHQVNLPIYFSNRVNIQKIKHQLQKNWDVIIHLSKIQVADLLLQSLQISSTDGLQEAQSSLIKGYEYQLKLFNELQTQYNDKPDNSNDNNLQLFKEMLLCIKYCYFSLDPIYYYKQNFKKIKVDNQMGEMYLGKNFLIQITKVYLNLNTNKQQSK